MKKYQFFISIVIGISSQLSIGAETDTFSKRNEPLADSSEIINKRANQYIQNSIKALNVQDHYCSEDMLYKELRKYFNNHLKGKLAIDIIEDNAIPRRMVILGESVYRSWRPWDGLGMGLTLAKRSGMTVSSVLKIGNELVGADKFEHFFGQGFYYFNDGYLEGKGAIRAIKKGISKEKTILGGNKIGNGVFSYGDLAANFNGMRFWNHVLQLREDVLGSGYNLGPYIECERQKWVQVKELDFRDYMDSSMDEAINCSKFPAKATSERFIREVNDLGIKCPVDQKKVEELSAKYGNMSKWIINKDGPVVIDYFGEFKNKK